MKKRIAYATAAAIAATTLVPGTAQAARAKTTVTIDFQGIHNPPALDGDLRSRKVACEKNRTVSVYEALAGADNKHGEIVTTYPGYWYYDHFFGETRKPGDKYYAKVKPKRGCKGDTSKVIEYQG